MAETFNHHDWRAYVDHEIKNYGLRKLMDAAAKWGRVGLEWDGDRFKCSQRSYYVQRPRSDVTRTTEGTPAPLSGVLQGGGAALDSPRHHVPVSIETSFLLKLLAVGSTGPKQSDGEFEKDWLAFVRENTSWQDLDLDKEIFGIKYYYGRRWSVEAGEDLEKLAKQIGWQLEDGFSVASVKARNAFHAREPLERLPDSAWVPKALNAAGRIVDVT